MERNLLVGNGINIQFGGLDVYSGSATMNRVVENIKVGKYTALTENALSIDEQLEILNGRKRSTMGTPLKQHRSHLNG